MPTFVWASLSTGFLTVAATTANLIKAYPNSTDVLPLFSDIAVMLLLSSGIVFMFLLWQTPKHS